MNKLTNTNNINKFSPESLEWKQVQNEMKNKLGLDVYESCLKKITFVAKNELIVYLTNDAVIASVKI